MHQLEGEESEDYFPKAADFGQILRTAHQSGHFMFQSEKKWLEEDASLESNPNFSKFFNLDTKFLNQCILSVPFNERHTFDINYTEKEKLEMLRMAEENEIKYKEMLEKSSSQPIASPKKIGKDPVKEITANVEKLDVKPEPKPSCEVPKNKDSGLQDWLDDILS